MMASRDEDRLEVAFVRSAARDALDHDIAAYVDKLRDIGTRMARHDEWITLNAWLTAINGAAFFANLHSGAPRVLLLVSAVATGVSFASAVLCVRSYNRLGALAEALAECVRLLGALRSMALQGEWRRAD